MIPMFDNEAERDLILLRIAAMLVIMGKEKRFDDHYTVFTEAEEAVRDYTNRYRLRREKDNLGNVDAPPTFASEISPK